MPKHKHAELIKAWADGAEIECRQAISSGFTEWTSLATKNPQWDATEYRIKPTPPAKQYPVTAMTQSQIMQAHKENQYCTDDGFCNAVLRHAVDYGTVVPRDEFDKCAADLLKAEETIRTLNEVIKKYATIGTALKV